jgi:chromosome segregation ATPase
MRFYMDYWNRRGKNYGAGMSDGCTAHVRGWRAGVRVQIGAQDADKDRDEVAVWMTSGSNGGHESAYLGTVRETKDGPRWDASANSKPSRSARAAALRAELAGLHSQLAQARRELDDAPAAARAELDDVRAAITAARAELADVPAAAYRELAGVTDRIAKRRQALAGMPEPRSADENHPGIARHALQLAISALEDAAERAFASGQGTDFESETALIDLRAELGRLDKPRITTTPAEGCDAWDEEL